MRLRTYQWCLALVPITVESFSVNYSIFLFVLKGPFVNPTQWGLLRSLALIIYFLCFFQGIIIFSELDADFMLRQCISMFVFMAVLSLLYVKIENTPEEIASAAVIVALLWSAWVWIAFFRSGLTVENPYGIKADLRDYVPDWPQRYIVVVSFAASFLFGLRRRGLLVIAAFAFLMLTVFLSFTRAAWVGTMAGIFACLWCETRNSTHRNASWLRRGLPYAIFALVVAFGATLLGEEGRTHAMGVAERILDLVNFFTDPSQLAEGSDRERFAIWLEALGIIEKSPLFGTGFAGIYLFPGDVGSAHSQYVDMFLRTGILGLALFLAILAKALAYYWTRSPAIFGGLVSIMIIGFAHETVKLSYGGIIVFALASLALSSRGAAHREPVGDAPFRSDQGGRREATAVRR